ncbi:MAG: ion transporter [Planctomycetota bacterium]
MSSRFDEFEDRLERIEADTDPDPHAKAARLATLEQEMLEAIPDACREDPALAASVGHPVLAEGSRWRDLAREAGAPQAAAQADDLVAGLIDDESERWKQAHLDGKGDAFRALADARAFDLEAMSRRRTPPPLKDVRPRLRERFLADLRLDAPTETQRDDWVTELLDRANVTLTSADDMEPQRAQACLALVRDDLEWHARNVETKGARRARLLYKVRRLSAESQERFLAARLARRFGAKAMRRWNVFIVVLVLFVLALFAWELSADLSARAILWFEVIDTVACGFFLWDFFVRLYYVRDRTRWFFRHFLTDFLPSLPFAMISRAWTPTRSLRLLRVLRYLRLVRVFGFFTRGVDSLVRRYGHLLNRNVILYPTREERRASEQGRSGLAVRVRRLQGRLNRRWDRLLTTSLHVDREQIAQTRVDGLERMRVTGFDVDAVALEGAQAARDLSADDLLAFLATLTPEELEAAVGQDFVARAARGVRLVSMRPIRWTPFLRRYVPRLAPDMTDAEVVVAGAQSAAAEMGRHHRRWFWFADLYGTVTPAQFIDRVGTTMFKASLRPAYRLALFGLAFLLLSWLVNQFALTGILAAVRDNLERIVKGFLLVLGSICFGTLGIGWWLRNLAGQATDFFAQSARAQFLDLTEAIKGRHIERDAAILDNHVFSAERIIHGREEDPGEQIRFVRGVRKWLIEAQAGDGITRGFDPVERTAIIYRDSLDGALFVRNDTRTMRQLLGNPALRTMRLLSDRFTRRDTKELLKLDLDQSRSFMRGPYVWFSLTCQAVAHGVARLIVDYNRHCLPLDQRATATPSELGAFETWLAKQRVEDVANDQVLYVTTHFTALHFLDDDPDRDREIGVRFGEPVLERMRRDRRNLFRRVFGTYPLHTRPREQRVINLYGIYQSWFAGGRSLVLPFRMAGMAIGFFARLFRWLAWCIREVRHPSFAVDEEAVRGADYETATRKVWRMRGPVAEAILRKRARFDPEYLGLFLPGHEESGLERAQAEHDLDFLRSSPVFRASIEEERMRAAEDLVRLGRLLRDGLRARLEGTFGKPLSREHERAIAVAYVSDMGGARSHLSAKEILEQVYERSARHQALPWQLWPRPMLWWKFRTYWSKHGEGDFAAQRAAWRATKHDVRGVQAALQAWTEFGAGATSVGEEHLAELVRHPERVTDQLVTLRAVQTLSLIDVLNYRGHVYRMGRYEEDGDSSGGTLDLR